MNKFKLTTIIASAMIVIGGSAFLTKSYSQNAVQKPQEAIKPVQNPPQAIKPMENIKQATPTAVTKPQATNQQINFSGRVIDASTKKPITGALVTLGNEAIATGSDGSFQIKGIGNQLKFRAPGYARMNIDAAKLGNIKDVALTPFKVKALYLTVYGTASGKIRDNAIKALKRNNMNALVLDVKGDRGFIPFKVNIPMAEKIGAQNTILIKDMPEMIARLKAENIYLIARIVVFKDDMLAGAYPEWAVKKNGVQFRDREKLRWVDPFRKEVWAYNIEIAKAAAAMGFDEVQFDYVRCPDTKGITFSQPSNIDTRTATITGFLEAAHKALTPYNVMVAADIFGYVLWNTDDTGIGQQIDKAINAVDIVSPMLYPSGFHLGIPKYRNPVQNSYEIVYLTLKNAQERTNASPLKFRPWLQAFRDYAFHAGDFSEKRMREQIKASNDFGASGYMFWNPRNVYPSGEFDN